MLSTQQRDVNACYVPGSVRPAGGSAHLQRRHASHTGNLPPWGGAQGRRRHFPKEDTRWPMSASDDAQRSFTREVQVQTIRRYHPHPSAKQQKIPSADHDAETGILALLVGL